MNLDEAQKNVSRLPVESKTVVHAGPGSGKSLTLIERLKFLISEAGVSVGEILVISFSVAAKEELDSRIKQSSDNETLRLINPRTLDSLSTEIIRETTGTCSGDFISRIRQVTKIIQSSTINNIPSIDNIKHILIDEAQDIVGSRAELLLTILRRKSPTAGFTIFADFAQSIYDFQLNLNGDDEVADEEAGMTSQQMIKALDSIGVNSIKLDNYYRSNIPYIKDICRIPWVLLLDDDKKLLAFDDLLKRMQNLTTIGGLSSGIDIKKLTGNTKAILCRTNYQVIAISSLLRENNPSIKLTISRSNRTPQRPYWISKILFGLNKNTLLDETTLAKPYLSLGESSLSLGDLILYLKKQLGIKRKDKLYVSNLVRALNDEISFKDIIKSDDIDLIISTIHRSKGKEYDSVAVFDEYNNERLISMFKRDKEKMACTLFVGLTRARAQLVKFVIGGTSQSDKNRMRRMRMVNSFTEHGGSRAIDTDFRNKVGTTVTKFEIGLCGDVDSSSFVRKPIELVRHEQSSILPRLKIGSAVKLKLNKPKKIYDIYVSDYGGVVGSMSPCFTSAIMNTLNIVQKSYNGDLPDSLEGGAIRGLSSAALVPGVLNDISREIIEGGIWTCLELEGWAKLVWHDQS